MKLRCSCYCVDDPLGHINALCVALGRGEALMCPKDKSLIEVKLYLLDFGLSSISSSSEDRAVDLYVLERGLTSTTRAHAPTMRQYIIESYEDVATEETRKKIKETIDRLVKVRGRGRKRELESV
eukprot:GHVH01006212.1.p1 GENE.GHVH01006212.1~~GHVH01006212.1.p1  ORF type:complete len:125 (-),score=17.43 GHVH01006212.1:6-380(-)